VSSNPLVRPNDYGIPLDAEHWDERTVRNVKLSWADTKNSKNFLWEKGFQFYCLTPKSRHSVHSSWANVDWHLIWNSNFGDPYRVDKRLPNVGEHQLHMNPQAAADLGIADGDYVYVDANPADRPYLGATPSDPFYKVSRLMLRLTFNAAYPYNVVMMKHGSFIATEKTVKAPQVEGLHEFPVWRRGGQSRCQHRAERMPDPHHESRRRRVGCEGSVEAGNERDVARRRGQSYEQIPLRQFHREGRRHGFWFRISLCITAQRKIHNA
jgi:hypothetical protein